MRAKTLESERLILEPLSPVHLSNDYVSWLNDPEVNMYMETRGGYTLQKLEAFLAENEKRDILFWAIKKKANGQHIGNIKIDPIDMQSLSGEYGILIGDKDSWGRGYAKEVSLLVLAHCFKELGLKKVTLGVIEANTNAIALYKKMGFKETGRIKDKGIYNGAKSDAIRMEITNEN